MRGLGQGWWWGGGSLCRVQLDASLSPPGVILEPAMLENPNRTALLVTLPSTGLRRRHAAPRRKRPLAHHSCRRLRLLHCSNAAGLPYGGLRAAIRVQIRSLWPVRGSRRQMHRTKRPRSAPSHSGGGSPCGSSSRHMGQTARGSGSGESPGSCQSLETWLEGTARPGEDQQTTPAACSRQTAAAAAPPCSPLRYPPSPCCPGGKASRRRSGGSASCSCCTGSSRSC